MRGVPAHLADGLQMLTFEDARILALADLLIGHAELVNAREPDHAPQLPAVGNAAGRGLYRRRQLASRLPDRAGEQGEKQDARAGLVESRAGTLFTGTKILRSQRLGRVFTGQTDFGLAVGVGHAQGIGQERVGRQFVGPLFQAQVLQARHGGGEDARARWRHRQRRFQRHRLRHPLDFHLQLQCLAGLQSGGQVHAGRAFGGAGRAWREFELGGSGSQCLHALEPAPPQSQELAVFFEIDAQGKPGDHGGRRQNPERQFGAAAPRFGQDQFVIPSRERGRIQAQRECLLGSRAASFGELRRQFQGFLLRLRGLQLDGVDKLKIHARQVQHHLAAAVHQPVAGGGIDNCLAKVGQGRDVQRALGGKRRPIPHSGELVFARRELGLGQIQLDGLRLRIGHDLNGRAGRPGNGGQGPRLGGVDGRPGGLLLQLQR